MTNEDAIELLDNLIGMVSDNQDSDYDTALKMAIKALEQEDILDKIDEIITDALDKSTDQKESQTLRWVLDKISEVT